MRGTEGRKKEIEKYDRETKKMIWQKPCHLSLLELLMTGFPSFLYSLCGAT